MTTKSNEAKEQANLMRWAALSCSRFPELDMLFHIPNGGARDKREGASLKRQGVKAGVMRCFYMSYGWRNNNA